MQKNNLVNLLSDKNKNKNNILIHFQLLIYLRVDLTA